MPGYRHLAIRAYRHGRAQKPPSAKSYSIGRLLGSPEKTFQNSQIHKKTPTMHQQNPDKLLIHLIFMLKKQSPNRSSGY